MSELKMLCVNRRGGLSYHVDTVLPCSAEKNLLYVVSLARKCWLVVILVIFPAMMMISIRVCVSIHVIGGVEYVTLITDVKANVGKNVIHAILKSL